MPKVSAAHEQKRREQILDAAMACFARQGYHATSVEDIVHESGLSVGAIYSYFGSKEDLFLAVASRRTEATLQYLNDLFGRPGPLAEKMGEAVDYFFDLLSEELVDLARVGFEFWSETGKSEKLHERQEHRCSLIRQFYVWLFDEAKQRGEVRADVDVAAAAELLMALNEGILVLHVNGMRVVDRAALKSTYIQLVNYGFSNPTATNRLLVPQCHDSASREAGPLESAGAHRNGHHTALDSEGACAPPPHRTSEET